MSLVGSPIVCNTIPVHSSSKFPKPNSNIPCTGRLEPMPKLVSHSQTELLPSFPLAKVYDVHLKESQDYNLRLKTPNAKSYTTNIEQLVMEIKQDLFSSSEDNPFPQVSVSAYDTAWVAMMPGQKQPERPMFPGCLDWVLQNQRQGGFWGELETSADGSNDVPTVDCLSATLACVVALKRWGTAQLAIAQGMDFIHANTEEILTKLKGKVPCWFAIVFPGMIEVARREGLQVFKDGFPEIVETIFHQRQKILLQKDDISSMRLCSPLESYLEVLPESVLNHSDVERLLEEKQSHDGSLYRSPSTTAFALMTTGNDRCMSYLKETVAKSKDGYGVPAIHPADDILPRLLLVDHLERLGCSELFAEEIDSIMNLVYRDWIARDEELPKENVALALYRDSLAFLLLRLKGYDVSPRKICWFVHDERMLEHMEENHTFYLSAMHNLHRASDVMFNEDVDLDKVRMFAKTLLVKATQEINWDDGVVVASNLHKQVLHELENPWLTRMDHLEQRNFIESGALFHDLLVGKASLYRLSWPNSRLLELATKRFFVLQSLYKEELVELKLWAKESGLSNIGFGREKTTYLYFAAASAALSSLPTPGKARKALTKAGIIVTVADDFYDSEGTIEELRSLTQAVQSWKGDQLSGSSRVIFEALQGFVEDICCQCFVQTGQDVTLAQRLIWKEAFECWLKEAEWSRSGYAPSMDEYLEVGSKSIAVPQMVLPACYLQCAGPAHLLHCRNYDPITNLVMLLSRLLNDTQSYQKEIEEGKLNMVMLYLMENPKLHLEDSIAYLKNVIERKKKEVLELMLRKDRSRMPKPWKSLHLSMLKTFYMFFNSANIYDTNNALDECIYRAFYHPLPVDHIKSKLLQ